MPRGARMRSRSGIYHIIWRGANRQEIFHDEEDCARFLAMLYDCKKKYNLVVYVWCLMNNHLHLLLREGDEDISVTMKRFGVSFVQYYNLKYETIGSLFQDRFKSEAVETKKYFLTVVRYMHQNPLKACIVQKVDDWEWSSCRQYYGTEPLQFLDPGLILGMFSEERAIARELFKEFNERVNDDECLDASENKRRFTDNEAKEAIM